MRDSRERLKRETYETDERDLRDSRERLSVRYDINQIEETEARDLVQCTRHKRYCKSLKRETEASDSVYLTEQR